MDGDLIEMFLEMNEDMKMKVVKEVNAELLTKYTVKGMSNYLQDIRIKHCCVYWKHDAFEIIFKYYW